MPRAVVAQVARPYLFRECKLKVFGSVITPKQLRTEFKNRGINLMSRTITYWIEKGLLPSLEPGGRGKGGGRGKLYYWAQNDILEQALLVHRILSVTHMPQSALWVLWFSGFNVPTKKIKELWSDAFLDALTKVEKKREFGESLHDIFWHLPIPKSIELTDGAETVRSDAEVLYGRLLIAVFSPPLSDSDEELSEIAAAVNNYLSAVFRTKYPEKKFPEISETAVGRYLGLLDAACSISNAGRLISTSSETELITAREYLFELGKLVCDYVRALNPEPIAEETIQNYFPGMAANFGPPIVRFIVQLMRAGREELIIRTVSTFQKFRGALKAGSIQITAPVDPNNPPAPNSEIEAIFLELISNWKDLDLFEVYNISSKLRVAHDAE